MKSKNGSNPPVTSRKARIWYERPDCTWVKTNGALNGPIDPADAFANSVAEGMRATAAAEVPLPSGGGSEAVSKRSRMASPRIGPA